MLKEVKLIKKRTVAVESEVAESLSTKLVENKRQAISLEKMIEFTGNWVKQRRRQKVSARKAFDDLFDKSDPQSV